MMNKVESMYVKLHLILSFEINKDGTRREDNNSISIMKGCPKFLYYILTLGFNVGILKFSG